MLKALVISDIHLGHDVNKTEDIIQNLNKFFKTYNKDIKLLDMLIISGDIFDQLLPSNGIDMNMIYLWLVDVVKICESYSITLRVLEGTPSHDWKQFKLLYNTLQKLNLNVDMKYFDTLDIEYDEISRKHIMYIPDEWKPTPNEIFQAAKLKLKEYNLKKVDMIIMHGAFSYQLPDFIEHTLDPEKFMTLTDGPIIVGHVHKHSKYKQIVVPGSFDALTHEDDYRKEKKGAVLLTINRDNKFSVKFLHNRYALKFITIPVEDRTIESITKELDKLNGTKIRVRLSIDNDSQLTKNLQELRHKYPELHITIKKAKKDKHGDVINKVVKKLDIIKLDREAIDRYIKDKEKNIEMSNAILNIMDKLG